MSANVDYYWDAYKDGYEAGRVGGYEAGQSIGYREGYGEGRLSATTEYYNVLKNPYTTETHDGVDYVATRWGLVVVR